MSIQERFKVLIKELDSNPNRLATEIGTTSQTFHGIIKNGALPSGKIIIALVNAYPSLNLNWLFTGEGSIFLPNDSIPVEKSDLLKLQNTVKALEKSLELREENALLMKKYLEVVEEKVKNLEQELADTKAKLKKHNS